MSIHPSCYTIFKDFKPEDKLTLEQTEILQEIVLKQINRTLAYAIMGYIDWLVYACVRYIENGGMDDLSHIERYITFPNEIDYKLQKKIIDDIYFIIRPILINNEKYKQAKIPERSFDIAKSIDWILKHTSPDTWNVMDKAIQSLNNHFKK